MIELPHQIERSIAQRKLFTRAERIVVAVSGGVDSMVQLHLLQALSGRHRWRLVVAHFNHQLRGAESDADERFVRGAATKLGLRCVVGRGDVRKAAGQGRGSVEMVAREMRHAFLARIANRVESKAIALAHHADDQLELFFLRLLRGSGGEGLADMKWTSPSPGDRTIRLVRPLLDQSKAGLRAFAEEQRIAFREDSTNAADDFLRNRIRNKLIPALLERYQPALLRTALRTMEIIGAEQDFVRETARAWLQSGKPREFERLHPAVQRQVIQIQLAQLGMPIEFDLVEKLRAQGEGAVTVAPNVELHREAGGRIEKRRTRPVEFDSASVVVPLDGLSGKLAFAGVTLSWRLQQKAVGRPRFRRGVEYFDADKVGSPIHLRHWRAGDRFRPIGMGQPVKVQDLFVNGRISRERRRQAVVAATKTGEIFWVEGLRMSEGFKLDKQTVRRLKWQWRR